MISHDAPEQRDPVEVLRQRLQAARNGLAVTPPEDCDDTIVELSDALTVLNAVCAKVAHPAVQAVARELVGTGFDPASLDGVFAIAAAMVLRHEIAELRGHCDLIEGKSSVYPPPHQEWIKGVRSAADWLQLMVDQIERDETRAGLAAHADEQARPVVQRILDGELGAEAALAMTRVVLDLAHARGQVKALERAVGDPVGADDTGWPRCSQCGGSGYRPCAPGSPHPAVPPHEDTEWCVFVGDDPGETDERLVGLSREYAEELCGRINTQNFSPGSFLDCVIGDIGSPARIALRTAGGPWQVVDTEGGA